jgi:hypothetical protein
MMTWRGQAAPIRRACRRSIFAIPYIWRFTNLSFCDLAFGLTIRTALEDGASDGGLVLGDAGGKGRDQARTCVSDPRIEIIGGLCPDDGGVEAIDNRAGFGKGWHAALNGGDGYGIGLPQMIPRRGPRWEPAARSLPGCVSARQMHAPPS